jgi:hypothetical protein
MLVCRFRFLLATDLMNRYCNPILIVAVVLVTSSLRLGHILAQNKSWSLAPLHESSSFVNVDCANFENVDLCICQALLNNCTCLANYSKEKQTPHTPIGPGTPALARVGVLGVGPLVCVCVCFSMCCVILTECFERTYVYIYIT